MDLGLVLSCRLLSTVIFILGGRKPRMPRYCVILKVSITGSEYRNVTVSIALLIFSAIPSLHSIEE